MKKTLLFGLLLASHYYAIGQSTQDLSVFQNQNLTKLKKNVTLQQISAISSSSIQQAATDLFNHTYPLQQRFRSYSSYLHPKLLASQMKTSSYSAYENPTGIYFDANDEAVIWLSKTTNPNIKLVVVNWDDKNFQQESYPLKPGYNTFKVKNKGNSYIQYFTEGKKQADVDVHILSGKVNGVFNPAKNNNADYVRMLAGSHGPVVDLVGKKVHLAYSVKSLQKENPSHGVELMQLYDSLITIQHEIMGLVKYKKEPKNHMFGRVIWEGFMHADHIGAAFHDNTMQSVANIPNLRKNSWGVAHEFGHVNQVRPNMKWVGTTEVTNNIYSVWTQYLYNTTEPKLEREVLKDYDERKVGGRITSYMESAFVHKQPWLTQAGPDRWERERPRDWGGDHFVKLVPLWQLQLYFVVAGAGNSWGQKDFYADIFNKAAQQRDAGDAGDKFYQLEFVKNACDAARLDLTDFFEKSGILAPIDYIVDDYTVGRMRITEADIREVKQYASKFPKPSTPVLHYITANSTDIYKNKLPMEGNTGKGFTKEGEKIVVDNSQWQHAVAFETWSGDTLVKVAFRGAGSPDASKTIVHIPAGTTAVQAIGWDGKKINVI